MRPRLLFIGPTWPQLTGNGLAMRAAQVSRALANRFEVRLAILSDTNGPDLGRAPPPWCATAEALPAQVDTLFNLIGRIGDERQRLAALSSYPRPVDSRLVSPGATARIAELASDVDHVHVMRLYLAPLVQNVARAAGRPVLTLDCDDDDAAYHRRRAAWLDPDSQAEARRFEWDEAEKYEAMKARWLPVFDRVFVASLADVDQMAGARRVDGLPNVIDAPRTSSLGCNPASALRLMFVGNLTYAPNADAVRWLSAALAPELCRRWPGQVEIAVIGGGLANAEAFHPALKVLGPVADLGAVYDACDVAVAPLRFGSGTPLKVIEAFAYGRPMVATPFAVAGLEVAHGRELLTAETPAAFADACISIKRDRALREALAVRARRLWETHYSPQAMDSRVRDLF